MATMTEIEKDHPMRKAWEEYRQTDDYANTRHWAHGDHVDGSLWAAFCEGWKHRALLRQLPAPSPAPAPLPEGMALVPREPTDEMLSEGHGAMVEVHVQGNFGECGGLGWNEARACWDAMLAASPGVQDQGVPTCEWHEDDGLYHSACGGTFEIIDGTPTDNRMTHCCYCGGRLVTVVVQDSDGKGEWHEP